MSSFIGLLPFDFAPFNFDYEVIFNKIITNINNISDNISNNISDNIRNYSNYNYYYYNRANYTLIGLAILYTSLLCLAFGILINLIQKEISKTKRNSKINENVNENGNENGIENVNKNGNENGNKNYNSNDRNQIMVQQQKQLYYQSIHEVLSKNVEIISKMKPYDNYWVLLRVVMKNPLAMKRSKYQLHGNNTGTGNGSGTGNSRNQVFNTKDMFMIIRMKYSNSFGKEDNFSMGNSIIRCMNQLNIISDEKYKTKDFIVVAIGNTNDNTNPIEFYNGLINNNYELYNYRDVIIKVAENVNIGYILLLPINKVYDIFMDVYNNTLFESKKYEMDDNNYESWAGNSINELDF